MRGDLDKRRGGLPFIKPVFIACLIFIRSSRSLRLSAQTLGSNSRSPFLAKSSLSQRRKVRLRPCIALLWAFDDIVSSALAFLFVVGRYSSGRRRGLRLFGFLYRHSTFLSRFLIASVMG